MLFACSIACHLHNDIARFLCYLQENNICFLHIESTRFDSYLRERLAVSPLSAAGNAMLLIIPMFLFSNETRIPQFLQGVSHVTWG